jgi:hypothetical protein
MRQCKHVLLQGLHNRLTRDSVPVIVAFTKFDQIVEIEGGSSARTRARTQVEQSCRSLFRKEPSDVPAEVVSGSCCLVCGTPL